MAFNSDMLPILGNIFSDDRLAGDHRVLPGAAPPSIGSFVSGFFSRASTSKNFDQKRRRWRKNRLISTDRGTNILSIVREPLANIQYQ